MKNLRYYLLALLSGFLLHLAWTNWCPGYFVFLGFVPLLFIEQDASNKKISSLAHYKFSIIAFLFWNILNTWWLKNASFAGMLVAFIINTFLYSGTFQLFHLFKKITNPRTGYFSLVIFWLAMEYIYINGEISWTWLNLGNAFAKDIKAIQWYEFTGTFGGSLWVLVVNLMIFRTINIYLLKTPKNLVLKNTVFTLLLIVAPIIISLTIFKNYEEKKKPVHVVAVQPNVDPYEKFGSSHFEQTLDLIKIASEYADTLTDYIICPETAVTSYSDIYTLNDDKYVTLIRNYLKNLPQANFIVGFTLKKEFKQNEDISVTAQKYRNTDIYFDTYNSALQIDTSKNIQIYHKSQLVVGVEKMPYPRLFGFLRKLMVRLGGTFRSHAIQKERENLVSARDSISIAPVICYENIFGEYVTDYVKKGSNLIFVITNEGWWGDTQSHRHLNYYSGLRAIENRRSVVRSANTGTSSIINQKGEQIQTLGWWKKGALKGVVNANDKLTFYTKHGDYLGKTSLFFTVLSFLYWIVALITKRKKTY